MKFRSNLEYFDSIREFAAELDEAGNTELATKVRESLTYINGLTEGWADHLETLLEYETSPNKSLTADQRSRLTEFCDAAYEAVYRRKRL